MERGRREGGKRCDRGRVARDVIEGGWEEM